MRITEIINTFAPMYVIYSIDLGLYVGKDDHMTRLESEAKRYSTIGEAMRRASQCMALGGQFKVFYLKKQKQ